MNSGSTAVATTSHMYIEAGEASCVVARQLQQNAAAMRTLGAELRALAPRAVVTLARGSSDHAATFAKYLIETRAGILTSSAAPSLSSVYEAKQDLRGVLFLTISQSGGSPDLLAAASSAKANGAYVVALCNSPQSPLSRMAHFAVDLHAGKEQSVAATKSFIASLSAIIHLVGSWSEDRELLQALEQAPAQLAAAWMLDWGSALPILRSAVNLFVVGRGYGLAAAQEAALKLKETCGLHAEAFSAAEVRHGPMALVNKGFPVLAFSQSDETRADIEAMCNDFVRRNASVMIAGTSVTGAIALPTVVMPTPTHAVIEPLLMIQSFYKLVTVLAPARGLDPDQPPHLRKVTETM
jgi:glucosamine--fructose-6-phosphate aminotransferase (isomerizing)